MENSKSISVLCIDPTSVLDFCADALHYLGQNNINIAFFNNSIEELNIELIYAKYDIFVFLPLDCDKDKILKVITDIKGKVKNSSFIVIDTLKSYSVLLFCFNLKINSYQNILEENYKSLINAIMEIAASKRVLKETQLEANKASRLLFLKKDISLLRNHTYDIETLNTNYGLNFKQGAFRALILKLDCPENIDLVFENDNFRETVKTVVQQCLNPYCYDIIFDSLADGVLILLNYSSNNKNKVNKIIKDLFVIIRSQLVLKNNIKVTLCISREYEDLEKLPEAKFEVLDARWSRMSFGTNKILTPYSNKEIESYSSFLNELSSKILHSIELIDITEVTRLINDFFGLSDEILSSREARIFIRKIIDFLFEFYTATSKDTQIAQSKHQFIYNVNMSNNFSELKEIFTSKVNEVLIRISTEVSKNYSKPIIKAINFINIHFRENISLIEVASKINLTPTYFSTLFKNEVGKNYKEYVTGLKLNVAKKLLENSDKTITEVAGELGFYDVRNFSKFFKENITLTPKEYRNIYLKKEF